MDSDSEGEEVCPLCCNALDATDLNFLPCPFGYQVCLYCYGRLEKDFNSRCPACRNEYGEGKYKITNPAELLKYVKKFTKAQEGRKALRKKRRAERERQKTFKQAESSRQQVQGFQRVSAQQQLPGTPSQSNHNQKHLTLLQQQQIAELRQRSCSQQQQQQQQQQQLLTTTTATAGFDDANSAGKGGKVEGYSAARADQMVNTAKRLPQQSATSRRSSNPIQPCLCDWLVPKNCQRGYPSFARIFWAVWKYYQACGK